ncbi:hypothetical protein ACFL6I_29490 [candidate division KSB1 bacterium]
MQKRYYKKFIMVFLILIFGYSLVVAQGGDAELMLKPSKLEAVKDDEITVDIVLKNPSRQKVISVRSWLSFDPTALEATSINTSNSPFTLSAPGEDMVSMGEGRVKIGRSNITGGFGNPETTVATVSFRVLATSATNATIDFYDYQVSELGHTSVNIIDQGFPLNILSRAPESIQLNLNAGVTPPPPPTTTTTLPPPITPTTDLGGQSLNTALMRPMDLKANTGAGYVDLKWGAAQDSSRMGFNIYYGKTSGQYTRRRTTGNFDNYRLDGLNNNETYYFAVTAYDQFNRESDYSNEVGVIINQPLSSTSPFATMLQQTIARIPVQPQNGPLVGWLIFSSIGLGAAIVFGRKKQKIEISNL